MLRSLRKLPRRNNRIAIVGIGNELRGDDAAGILVARALQPLAAGRASILVIDAGPVPENFSGPLRRFAPGLVLLVDAAEMGAAPGEAKVFPWQEAGGVGGSTHSLPLHLLAGYLSQELGCEAAIVGLQPESIDLEGPVSAPVAQAVERTLMALRAWLGV